MNMQQFIEQLVALTMQKVFMIGLLAGGLFYFTFYDDGSALEGQLKSEQNLFQEEKKKEADTKRTLQEKDRMEAEVNRLSTQYKEISGKLPTMLSGLDVVKLIDETAKETKVSVKKQSTSNIVEKEIYEEVPIKVKMTGTFSQLTQFVYLVASTERVSRVRDIQFSTSENYHVEKGKLILDFEGDVVGYRFVGEKETQDTSGKARRK